MQAAKLSSSTRGSILAALALALVIGALLHDTLFTSAVLSQSDALEQFAPWSDASGAEKGDAAPPSNPVLLDQSIMMQPWQYFASQRIHRGTPPIWNPNNYLGQPMVSTYQAAYFWPLNWIYYAFPSWGFLAWSAALRLFAAGLFTYLFLRRLALRTGPAALGAVSFALSGFMIAWLGHMHTHVALFLPAFFWLVERTVKRPTLRNSGLVALFVGGALFAGHLQTAVYVAIAAAAYSGFRFFVRVNGTRLTPRGFGQLVVGVLLGVLFAMPQLLPFFSYLNTSSGVLVFGQIETVSKIAPLDAAVLSVDPGHFGSPAVAQNYGPYTGPSGMNVNYSELIGGYVGRVALGLAFLGAALALFRRRRDEFGSNGVSARPAALFFVVFGLFTAAVAWQVWPVYDFMASLPKLKSTKLMRFSLLLAFSLSTLAAFGLDGLLAWWQRRGTKDASRSAAAIAVLATFAVGAELVAFGHGYNPALDPDKLAPTTAVTDYLGAQLPSDGSPATWRALGINNTTLFPSANLYYDIPMVSGYDSLETRTTTELVALMSSDPNGAYFIKEIAYFDQAWQIGALLGVRYVLSPIDLPQPFELVLDGPTKIFQNPAALPRAFAATHARLIENKSERLAYLAGPSFNPYEAVLEQSSQGLSLTPGIPTPLAPAEVTLDSYDDLQVKLTVAVPPSPSPALIVLTDAWDAGWQAELNGKPQPIERVDHALRGVIVPSGIHQLTFRYRPPAITIGLALGATSLLVILALLFLPNRKRKTSPKPPLQD